MTGKMSKRGRKRKLGAEDKAVFEWENDRILPENLRDEMETMWELPQIYHFLQLTKEALNITHLSMYEVERMLLMPKASRQLSHIMTCLLSSPSTTKAKLQKVPPMPYEFWTNILLYKLRSWFKIYQTKRHNSIKAFDTLGIEPEFWKNFPDATEIEGKDFQDFSFKQRVWLLKTVCDTAMHSRKTIQDEMAKQPLESQFETVLGIDRYGARYIYFPQFLHNDLRVYKHCLDNKVLSTVKPPVKEVKPKVEVILKKEPKTVPRVMSRKKRRKSRWSSGSLPPKKLNKKKILPSSVEQSTVDSNSNSIDAHLYQSSESSSKASEISTSSLTKSSGYETNSAGEVAGDSVANEKCNDDSKKAQETKVLKDDSKAQIEEAVGTCDKKTEVLDELDKPLTVFSKAEDSSIKENSFTTMDDLSKSSKTDDEKLEEMSSFNASKNSEKSTVTDTESFSALTKDVNISKSDDEKLSESIKCDTPADSECLNNELSLDKWVEAKRKEKIDTSVDSESIDDEMTLDKWIEAKRKEKIDRSLNNSDNNSEFSDSALSSGTRRSARIKHISEIKIEAEDAENMLDVCKSEELSSIQLRDSLCRVSSPEMEVHDSNGDFNEREWKIENFNELINDLSVSNFQLVADSLDSLKDLTEYIASDKTIPGHEMKKENFIRPKCEDKLLKRLKVLCTSLEEVETILKESTKKARCKLQREWNNFENGVTDEDQDLARSSEDANSCWVMGPQASLSSPFQNSCSSAAAETTSDRARSLSHPTLSSAGELSADEATPADPAEAPAQIAAQKAGPSGEKTARRQKRREKARGEEAGCKEEASTEVKEECEKKDGSGQARKKEEGREKTKNENEDEPRRTTRVLRARGVSSYTEQLFSDDESEEDKLDGWADIEAIYASPSAQVDPSAPNTPNSKAHDSCNDSEKEDSDQDWILPSSRKRKSKRPSASRRLKSFQHKLQNIRVDQDGGSHVDSLQPSAMKDTKAQLISPAKIPINKLPPKSPLNRSTPNRVNANSGAISAAAAAAPVIVSSMSLNPVKSEPVDPSLHSVLDIKDEGPVYDNSASTSQTGVQPNYVVVTTGHAPVANYYVMHQNPPVTAVMQQNQFIQPTAYVSQMVPQQVQAVSSEGYYVQQNAAQNYIVQNPTNFIATAGPRQAFIASNNPQMVYQQSPQLLSSQQQVMQTPQGYVQYVATPQQQTLQQQQQSPSQPRIINTTTLSPPRQIYRMRAPAPNIRPQPRPSFPHPNGAVIRSVPLAPTVLRPGQRAAQPRPIAPKQQTLVKVQSNKHVNASAPKGQKPTSLIVLSDSDDEIEMIIPTKTGESANSMPKPKLMQESQQLQQKNKPVLPAELMQRMSEGNISISPIKPAQPVASSQSTQLVVVVNETGSHYALALPNGSKLILTPDQVAQIRASNGGKLVL